MEMLTCTHPHHNMAFSFGSDLLQPRLLVSVAVSGAMCLASAVDIWCCFIAKVKACARGDPHALFFFFPFLVWSEATDEKVHAHHLERQCRIPKVICPLATALAHNESRANARRKTTWKRQKRSGRRTVAAAKTKRREQPSHEL